MSSAAWATPSSSTAVPSTENLLHRRHGRRSRIAAGDDVVTGNGHREKVSVLEVEPSTFGVVAMPRPAA